MYLLPEPKRYRVRGRLLLHDGFSIVTERAVNPLQVEVDEVVIVEWRENASFAAALRIRGRHSRCLSEWWTGPQVRRDIEPHQEPPDRVLRAIGAATLPGMD